MTPEAIRKKAEDILAEYGISAAPVPVEKIARKLGAKVRYSPLDDELSGLLYIKADTPIIGVNSKHHINRRRFTIAHEIGHLVLHKNKMRDHVHVDTQFPVLMRDQKSAQGIEDIEIEANRFAAELLMPYTLLNEMLKSKEFDIDDEEPLNSLAKKFRVSRQALNFRIINLHN